MLTERQGERLPDWLDAVRQDDLLSLHTLAAGIDREPDAVIAGLTLPWTPATVQGDGDRGRPRAAVRCAYRAGRRERMRTGGGRGRNSLAFEIGAGLGGRVIDKLHIRVSLLALMA